METMNLARDRTADSDYAMPAELQSLCHLLHHIAGMAKPREENSAVRYDLHHYDALAGAMAVSHRYGSSRRKPFGHNGTERVQRCLPGDSIHSEGISSPFTVDVPVTMASVPRC